MRDLKEARLQMKGIHLPKGEMRSYMQCRSCGNVFVRDYIPYGLGEGRTYGPCMCVITQRQTSTELAQEQPDGMFTCKKSTLLSMPKS